MASKWIIISRNIYIRSQPFMICVIRGGNMKRNSKFLDSHFIDNFTIQEVGMKLIPEHRSKIWSKLKSLEMRSPIMTTIHLSFTALEKDIQAELVILGVSKKFFASAAGENPWELYQVLEKEIDTQLSEWKESRFMAAQFPFSPEAQKAAAYE